MDDPIDIAYRVLADHARTLTFAIADGAVPGNEGRGYVLRRILRRAARFGLELGCHEPFMYRLVATIVETMGDIFGTLTNRAQHAATVIQAEEAAFARTLSRGIDIFNADVAELEKTGGAILAGDKVFRLYDTYGFPADLTALMAREKGLDIDTDGFEALMDQQRSRARASQKDATYQSDALAGVLPGTDDHEKYHSLTLTASVVGCVHGETFINDGPIPTDDRVGLILDATCAYGESGGQVGDKGIIAADGVTFAFDDTRIIGKAVVHFGSFVNGSLHVGRKVTVHIDSVRLDIQRNHTATHLLQWALQQVLGEHAHQEGSLVNADYLRFDFTHPAALTPEQLQEIQHLVRQKISDAIAVTSVSLPIEQAKALGAMALFSEKYGDVVRVLAIGTDNADALDDAFSREFCGGTHVANTADITAFKIIREESVATGVRRITAQTGSALLAALYQNSELIDTLCRQLKATPDQLSQRIDTLIEDNKKLRKQVKKGGAADLKSLAQDILDQADSIGDSRILIGSFGQVSVDAVRSQIDYLRKKAPSSAMTLAATTEDGKVVLFAVVSDDLIKKGLKAGDIVKQIAPIVGGGGGGRPQMAQAGGKDASKLTEALNTAKDIIKTTLS